MCAFWLHNLPHKVVRLSIILGTIIKSYKKSLFRAQWNGTVMWGFILAGLGFAWAILLKWRCSCMALTTGPIQMHWLTVHWIWNKSGSILCQHVSILTSRLMLCTWFSWDPHRFLLFVADHIAIRCLHDQQGVRNQPRLHVKLPGSAVFWFICHWFLI